MVCSPRDGSVDCRSVSVRSRRFIAHLGQGDRTISASHKQAQPFLADFMRTHRLRVREVAAAAGVSERTIGRIRGNEATEGMPRSQTLLRIAEALESLTHVDSNEIFNGLMREAGREAEIRQTDLGLRGAAELACHYQSMSRLGRHLLLEHARLLAHELPGGDSE